MSLLVGCSLNKCMVCGKEEVAYKKDGYMFCKECYEKRLLESQKKKEAYNNSSTQKHELFQPGRESDAWICAQDIVEQNLKAPASAKFCKSYEATVTYTGASDYKVEGYVDAENGFGANIRTNFTVTLTLTQEGYKNGLVTFDE